MHHKALSCTAAALGLATAVALPGLAEDAESLRAEVDALEARIAGLESAEESGLIVPEGTTFTIGGYVKADFIYDVDEALGDLFLPSNISVGGGDEDRFRAHARQTRLFFKTETETEGGPLRTHVEIDFFGTGGNELFSNSVGPRLRHAYGEWGGLLAGQTWSNFMPIESYPATVDFQGPAGLPFIRQTQLRYTFPVGESFSVSASLENSEFSGRTATGTISESTTTGIRAGLDGLPDFTLAGEWSGDSAFVKLAGLARELNAPGGGGESEFGWGVSLSGNAGLWPGGKVLGSVTYGDGVGRYIINGFAQDAFVSADGSLETIAALGANLGVRQNLMPTLTAGLNGGYYRVEDTFSATDTEEITTVHASLFWNPQDQVTLGGEVIWGERELASGASDDATRLQTSVQFTF